MSSRAVIGLRLVAAWAVLAVAAGGCSVERSACTADRQCGDDEVCYWDGRCMRRDVAGRAGGPVGLECGHDDQGCIVPGYCLTGYCVGEPLPPDAPVDDDAGPADGPPADSFVDVTPPTFAGVRGVYPDGDGALLVYWDRPTDDVDALSLLQIEIYRATTPGGQDFGAPIATVPAGPLWFREEGLTDGVPYYYVARARDQAGNVDTNTVEMSAVPVPPPVIPPGIDYDTQIQPLFDTKCALCHGGTSGLYLTSHAALLMGGLHGPVVVPCQPDMSNLVLKLGPIPPFGQRMPRTGPPFLSMTEIETIRRWIADGAEAVYNPATCP